MKITAFLKNPSFNALLLLLWVLPTIVFGVAFSIYNMNRDIDIIQQNLEQSRSNTINYMVRTSRFSLYAEDTETLQEITDSIISNDIKSTLFLLPDKTIAASSGDDPISRETINTLIKATNSGLQQINQRTYLSRRLYTNDGEANTDNNLLGFLILEINTDYLQGIKDKILGKTISLGFVLAFFMTVLSLWLSGKIAAYFEEISKGISLISRGEYSSIPDRDYPSQIEEVFSNIDRLTEELDSYKGKMQERVDIATESLSMTLNRMKKQNKLLTEAREEADRANNSKSHFLARMSHELKTPVNVILGFSKRINKENNIDAIKENNEYIYSSASQMNALISDLLDLSLSDSYKIRINNEFINIVELINNTCRQHKSMLEEKNISLKLYIDDTLKPYIYSDGIRLQQIVHNLLSNAIKFTDQGFVCINVKKLNEYDDIQSIALEVTDTGIGIDAKHIEHIFDSYIQLSESKKTNQGYGLGLPIVKQLVEALGGTIKVKSKQGLGAVFLLTFQFKSLEEIESNTVHRKKVITSELLTQALENKTILIAEDHDYSRLLLINTLEEFGIKTVETKTGNEALEILPSANPDLILLDYHMPEKTGIEVIVEINKFHKQFNAVPKLLMTADATFIPDSSVASINHTDVIYKPIDYNALVVRIFEKISGSNDLTTDFELKDVIDDSELRQEVLRLQNGISDAIYKNDIQACRQHLHKLNGISGLVKEKALRTLVQELGSTSPKDHEKLLMLCTELQQKLLKSA